MTIHRSIEDRLGIAHARNTALKRAWTKAKIKGRPRATLAFETWQKNLTLA